MKKKKSEKQGRLKVRGKLRNSLVKQCGLRTPRPIRKPQMMRKRKPPETTLRNPGSRKFHQQDP